MENVPTADRILSLLADLYADQTGMEITYEITEGCAAPRTRTARRATTVRSLRPAAGEDVGRREGGEAHVSIHG